MDRKLEKQVGVELIKDGLEKLASVADDTFRLIGQLDQLRELKEQYVLARSIIELGLKKITSDDSNPHDAPTSRMSYKRQNDDRVVTGNLSAEQQLSVLVKLADARSTGLLQMDLPKILEAHSSAVSRFLKKVEKLGFIERTRTEKNALRCFITEAGIKEIERRAITSQSGAR